MPRYLLAVAADGLVLWVVRGQARGQVRCGKRAVLQKPLGTLKVFQRG